MEIFALSFVVVAFAVLGMAAGALAGKPLARGCDDACESCKRESR